MKIIVDPGHGAGKEHNRGGLYFNEGDNNYEYSLVLKKELETYENVRVDLTRKNINENPTLSQRSAMGQNYDLFLSVHSNAAGPTARGTEVWDSVEGPSKALATKICDATATLFNHPNRGVKYREGQIGFDYYGVLRGNKAKAKMIVENGFHTNHDDCLFFKNNHQKLAEVQAKAIADFYVLKKKAPKPHWGEEYYNNLAKKGIKLTDKRYDDNITRAEAMALVDKATDRIIKIIKEDK